MKRNKQNTKIKEPVKLRAKRLANGNQSLYLDTYYKGKRVYEFLRLYLIPVRSAADKEANIATMRTATAIKSSRILSLINEKGDIKAQKCGISLQDWIERVITAKRQFRSISCLKLLKRLIKHLNKYRQSARLEDVDRTFCMEFAGYLHTATSLNSVKPLMQTTQYELFNALSLVLNEAVRAEMIPNNPMRLLNASERIRKPDSTREYLTVEEVKSMIDAAAANIKSGDDVAAFLFCCFCGLRYSDVSQLTWENLMETENGLMITTTMKKTRRRVEVPVSAKASSLLPKQTARKGKVFTFPTYRVTLKKLKTIAKTAGIKKKVTFHVSRHTFATMMLTAGTDLYTISNLIGHTDIRITQIYSKVIDKKKTDAMMLLDKLF